MLRSARRARLEAWPTLRDSRALRGFLRVRLSLLFLTQMLHRLPKTHTPVLHRKHLRPLNHALTAFPRVATTVAGAPARGLAAETPKLKQPGRKQHVLFRALALFIRPVAGHLSRHANSSPRRGARPGFVHFPLIEMRGWRAEKRKPMARALRHAGASRHARSGNLSAPGRAFRLGHRAQVGRWPVAQHPSRQPAPGRAS
jgi:hypothetical protein